MKDIGDAAFCNGLTRMVFHKFTHQPELDAVPGYQWPHVGTHINANTTWWNMSHAWLRYLQRCQYMLRQGLYVADIAYFYGKDISSFVRSKTMMNPSLPSGFDCDTFNAEALLTRADVKNGRLVLPDGMSYRYLVLPHTNSWKATPAVLRKITKLIEDGLTVIGPPPALQAPGLTDYPKADREVRSLVEKFWGTELSKSGERKTGKGRVIWGKPLASILAADELPPDVEFRKSAPDAKLDWIHRRDGKTDIYFISNQKAEHASVEIAFRIADRQPELWDAITGDIRDLPEFREADGRMVIPIQFEPRQSFFIVFRKPVSATVAESNRRNFPNSSELAEINGPWEVSFDPKWGGPEKALFDSLEDWTKRPEEGIRYYSGTAVYRKTFDLPQSARGDQLSKIFLNLGVVKNLAAVKLNGQDLGVIWTAPWRVDITGAVREKGNRLEISVVNLWPNRLIGDAKLPPGKRFAKTNVKTYLGEPPAMSLPGGCKTCDERKKTKDLESAILPSGLLGPVILERQK